MDRAISSITNLQNYSSTLHDRLLLSFEALKSVIVTRGHTQAWEQTMKREITTEEVGHATTN